ncbi:hypothetical protein [Cellulosimicrobium sp. CUA-896]|uniref:hypothetical protein n=1 Tax=Cellulosimicrobium sp. CUA-896 TaxID=1517881 RepID=UPI002100B638|nr:hypothetical protein [Cellulosimicrobium sp. CUA-896]
MAEPPGPPGRRGRPARRRPAGRPARAAEGAERERLWARWRELGDDVDGYAAQRGTDTAVVVLEPRTGAAGTPPA